MDFDKLNKIANSIPSMGGREIGSVIQEYVKKLKKDRAIVEVGAWLGSGTAQICFGVLKSGKPHKIYVYDRFKTRSSEKKKAKIQGVKIKSQNTLPLVKKYLQPFKCDIIFVQGETLNAKYEGEEIGLYINDADKRKEYFDYSMKVFSEYFVSYDTILILMDYFFFEKRNDPGLKYQYEFMQLNQDVFEFIGRIENTVTGIFRYKGGQIKYADKIKSE